MKLVLLSDTHTFHDQVVVPEGDVLVHAGDMCSEGSVREAQACLDWLDAQPHKHVVAIAGNHDWAFVEYKSWLKFGRIQYLENTGTEIDGVKFWGSPVQPTFCDWAFNVDRGAPIRHFWNMIPLNIDVLITHGPPWGVLDQSVPCKSPHLGCEELANRVQTVEPLVHVFGHIHGGYGSVRSGTHFLNASIVDESYKVRNTPFVVSIMV